MKYKLSSIEIVITVDSNSDLLPEASRRHNVSHCCMTQSNNALSPYLPFALAARLRYII